MLGQALSARVGAASVGRTWVQLPISVRRQLGLRSDKPKALKHSLASESSIWWERKTFGREDRRAVFLNFFKALGRRQRFFAIYLY